MGCGAPLPQAREIGSRARQTSKEEADALVDQAFADGRRKPARDSRWTRTLSLQPDRHSQPLAGANLTICTAVHTVKGVAYEWDAGKARPNLRKHDVDFADAVAIFEDEYALTMRDSFSEDEERWISIGMDSLGRVLVVVYTWRDDSIRLISARFATLRERRQYEERE